MKPFHLYLEGGPAPPMTSSICVFHLGIGLGCRLTWTGVGADYVDASSEMAAFDPSAHQPGPNALLLRLDLLERYLSEHNLEMCWAVTGEKQSTGTFGQPYGWLQFQGAYVLRNGNPIGKSKWLHNSPSGPSRNLRS